MSKLVKYRKPQLSEVVKAAHADFSDYLGENADNHDTRSDAHEKAAELENTMFEAHKAMSAHHAEMAKKAEDAGNLKKSDDVTKAADEDLAKGHHAHSTFHKAAMAFHKGMAAHHEGLAKLDKAAGEYCGKMAEDYAPDDEEEETREEKEKEAEEELEEEEENEGKAARAQMRKAAATAAASQKASDEFSARQAERDEKLLKTIESFAAGLTEIKSKMGDMEKAAATTPGTLVADPANPSGAPGINLAFRKAAAPKAATKTADPDGL